MGQSETHPEQLQDTTHHRDPALDFDQVLQEARLPIRLIDAAIGGVAEAGNHDPVKLLLFANEAFGDDLWAALGTSLLGLKQLTKAHDAEVSRMLETGELAGFRIAVAHYFGADVCTSLANQEVRELIQQGSDVLFGRRKSDTSLVPLAGSIDHLLTVLRHRLRSGSATAQLEQARIRIEEAIVTEEAVRNRPKPAPKPQRNSLDVIADGAAAAFARGETESHYLAEGMQVKDGHDVGDIMWKYRAKLIEAGRWPWAEISADDNGSPRPVPDPQAKRLARFDQLVADLSPERKIALLDRPARSPGRSTRRRRPDPEGPRAGPRGRCGTPGAASRRPGRGAAHPSACVLRRGRRTAPAPDRPGGRRPAGGHRR